MIRKLGERSLRTTIGVWREVMYYRGQRESIALVYGTVEGRDRVPFRVHSSCFSAHVLNSIECDCREQMVLAQEYIASVGYGCIIVLDQEGKGNGHLALMLATRLASEKSLPQAEAYRRLGFPSEARRYDDVAEILNDLKILSVEILTNNPEKEMQLRNLGISMTGNRRVAVDLTRFPHLQKYYDEKKEQGHRVD